MGGIDEAALDRLSLVTQMTKHIRVRAAGGRTTSAELGQFSPIFVWLLRVRCISLPLMSINLFQSAVRHLAMFFFHLFLQCALFFLMA